MTQAAKKANTPKKPTTQKEAAMTKAKAQAAKTSTLFNLPQSLSRYNGMQCTEVQALPAITGYRLMLVQVIGAEERKLQPLIAVREDWLASPERAKKADADRAKLTKVQAEIGAYLLSVGFKAGKDAGTWMTNGRHTYITILCEDLDPQDEELSFSVETHENLDQLSIDSLEDSFGVKSLAEFKKYMRGLFVNLGKDMANKEFLEVVEVAKKLSAAK